jgi:hypothetical protein
MKYNWFNISKEDREKWEALCPPEEYRVMSANVLKGLLPDGLINQYNSVLIMASGTSNGNVYYMANGNRVDDPDRAIDQMPFGLAFIGNNPIPSGCLLQHGDWGNRTIYPPQDFWGHVTASGISSYYPHSEMPPNLAGKIPDLKIDSQNAAFEKLGEVLKDQVDKG